MIRVRFPLNSSQFFVNWYILTSDPRKWYQIVWVDPNRLMSDGFCFVDKNRQVKNPLKTFFFFFFLLLPGLVRFIFVEMQRVTIDVNQKIAPIRFYGEFKQRNGCFENSMCDNETVTKTKNNNNLCCVEKKLQRK